MALRENASFKLSPELLVAIQKFISARDEYESSAECQSYSMLEIPKIEIADKLLSLLGIRYHAKAGLL
jgi:hypothetical protein